MRRAKIVATLGPATRELERIAALIEAGVDVFRLNLAHADPEIHVATAEMARKEADRAGKVVALLADLPGPKMRTGEVAGGEVALEAGRRFVLLEEERLGDKAGVSTTVEGLARMVDPGDDIFLADGAIVLRVVATSGGDVETEVVRRGLLRSRKGMHVPKAEQHVEAFTAEDRESLSVALGFGADLIGLSFIRDAEDLQRVREALGSRGPQPMLVAKIETRGAVQNLKEIVAETDAVMVARGDLGIQMPLNEVPFLQKRIIEACNEAGVPVITATQMLESMTQNPLPSRAEVADVANAVLDGTDALMLSEETAVGQYPVETVRAMHDIALTAQREVDRAPRTELPMQTDDLVSWAIARAAVEAAQDLGVAAIVCPTRSGATARRVAAFRPSMPILGLGHGAETIRPLALVWGVVPILVPFLSEEQLVAEGMARAAESARAAGLARAGDLVAVVAGGPTPRAGSTDSVRIVRV